VEWLLDSGADVDKRDENGQTLLPIVAEQGNMESGCWRGSVMWRWEQVMDGRRWTWTQVMVRLLPDY